MSHLQDKFARIFATNPAAPPPISEQELQRLRSKAWAEAEAVGAVLDPDSIEQGDV